LKDRGLSRLHNWAFRAHIVQKATLLLVQIDQNSIAESVAAPLARERGSEKCPERTKPPEHPGPYHVPIATIATITAGEAPLKAKNASKEEGIWRPVSFASFP